MISITPEQFDTAKKNGVSKALVRSRIQKCRWSIEKAISTPPKNESVYDRHKKWIRIAEQNGIKKEYFIQRVEQYGWSKKDASTLPIGTVRKKKA
ncbi:hypothetical protein MF628_000937 [Paenibacillus polymyxa]|uniref:hypothetical protein n=1 Tax=Paenibacillus polymyxa TaxID=1406 RepID=UPI0020240CA8|nr:hypothetical protein [Paenibacillus polymyxa]URJ46407.3 hypothetical protein MF628_000937 [Paenibacillus polymyxa]